jgi:AcrR family transcriptional regulator
MSSRNEVICMKTKSARRRTAQPGDAGGLSARDKLFAVAADLFYRKGIRAIGVETIVKEAGVAKISLYRSFASKDDLIVAYLTERNQSFWRQWDEQFSRHDDEPMEQLGAITRYLAHRTTQPGYRGCPFINYCAEFPDPSHPGHQVVEANKREMRRRLLAIAEGFDVAEPKELADGLMLLVEGTYAISQTLGGRKGPASAIERAAAALVSAAKTAH